MHIETHKPELQVLFRQTTAIGGFKNAEEVLLHALRAALPQLDLAKDASVRMGSELVAAMQAMPYKDVDIESARGRTLEEVFAKVRGLADDLDFSRDLSLGHPVDFL